MREESRSGHTRVDFPGESPECLKYLIVTYKNSEGKMKTEKISRPEALKELEAIANATIEDLEK